MFRIEIGGFSRYKFYSNGAVLSKENNSFLRGSTNPAGYHNYRLTDDYGITRTIGRHRIVASIFYMKPLFSDLVVNHINGIKGDDRPDNLEWVTTLENIHHAGALGLTEKCLPVSVMDIKTGIVTHFNSAIDSARHFNLSKDTILYRITQDEDRIYPEGLKFRKRDDSKPWSTEGSTLFGRSKGVIVFDVEKNTQTTFSKSTDAAVFIGISLSTLNTASYDLTQPLLKGRFLVQRSDSLNNWRKIEDLKKERFPHAIIVIDSEGVETFFESVKQCSSILGINSSTLCERLKSNGTKTFSDGLRFRYYQFSPVLQ